MQGTRILIVEARDALRKRFCALLRTSEAAYELREAATTEAARTAIRAFKPHAAVIDLDVDGYEDGLHLCDEIRDEHMDVTTQRPGVIMVSTQRPTGSEWRAMLCGADLCLFGPACTSPALLESVHGLMRLMRLRSGRMMVHQALVISPEAGCAWIDGRHMELTSQQFSILLRLVRNAGRALSHAALLGEDADLPSCDPANVAYVQLAAIRTALGEHRGIIRTVRGRGYTIPTFSAPKSSGS